MRRALLLVLVALPGCFTTSSRLVESEPVLHERSFPVAGYAPVFTLRYLRHDDGVLVAEVRAGLSCYRDATTTVARREVLERKPGTMVYVLAALEGAAGVAMLTLGGANRLQGVVGIGVGGLLWGSHELFSYRTEKPLPPLVRRAEGHAQSQCETSPVAGQPVRVHAGSTTFEATSDERGLVRLSLPPEPQPLFFVQGEAVPLLGAPLQVVPRATISADPAGPAAPATPAAPTPQRRPRDGGLW